MDHPTAKRRTRAELEEAAFARGLEPAVYETKEALRAAIVAADLEQAGRLLAVDAPAPPNLPAPRFVEPEIPPIHGARATVDRSRNWVIRLKGHYPRTARAGTAEGAYAEFRAALGILGSRHRPAVSIASSEESERFPDVRAPLTPEHREALRGDVA